MDWEDLRTALPEDKAHDLREVIAETLMTYGVTIVEIRDGAVLLRDAKGRGLTWQTQSVSRQLLTLDAPAAWSPALPLAELGDGTGVELRRPADRVLIVALFERPFAAAFRRKLALVQRKYPGWSGFGAGNDQFDRDERDYKLVAGRGLTAALRRAPAGEALLDALGEAAKTNLLNWRLKDAFSPATRRDEQSRVFGALLAHRDEAAAHPQAIADFIEAWRALNPDGSRDTARQIAEYLLFLCRPDAAILFKHGVLHEAYYEATARPFPSADAASDYAEELRFAEGWREALTDAGHPPRDLFDVQSFLWVSHGGSAAPPPESETPKQMPDTAEPPRPKEDTAMKTLNTILYGPPGTGKTYATFRKAVEICDGAEAPTDRDVVKARYAQLREAGRIGFVTFHQSYSYEEFVEGLRPEGGDGEAGFRLVPKHGALRAIAELAQGALHYTPETSMPASDRHAISLEGRAIYKMSIGRAGVPAEEYLFEEAVTEGHTLLGFESIDFTDPRYEDPENILAVCRAEGTREGEVTRNSGSVAMLNTFRNELKVGDIIVVSKGNSAIRAIGEVTGDYHHVPRPEGVYTQRRSVNWLWVHRPGLPVGTVYDGNFTMRSIYPLDPKRLNFDALQALIDGREISSADDANPFVLVIDEINRANISKVFGELITLLEEDKRAGAENEVSVRLPYSGDDFTLPANLHILGTMNTADRSIALLDTALRRRFHFEETPPQPDLLKWKGGLDLSELLKRLNARIEYLLDRDHLIGHAFFMGCENRADVDIVMRRKVIPLLAEYFHEDWERIVAVLGGAAQAIIAKEPLAVPPGLDLGMDEVRYRYTVLEPFPQDAYAGLQA